MLENSLINIDQRDRKRDVGHTDSRQDHTPEAARSLREKIGLLLRSRNSYSTSFYFDRWQLSSSPALITRPSSTRTAHLAMAGPGAPLKKL
jgi:hypothetical protein